MTLEDYKRSKLTGADFRGKFLFGQKGPKNGLFLLFLKIQSLVFSDIVHKVRGL